jgi:Sulfotransferase family
VSAREQFAPVQVSPVAASGLARERSWPKSGRAPVFVVGSPRSGTTLLYHMLLSAGGFAVYLTESKVFDGVFPQVGGLRTPKSRRKALDLWLRSKLFALSGLEREPIEARILGNCRSGGDFLRIVMEQIAESQNVGRWADNTPEHVLYLSKIKREIPDALVIHMIRDGRDVALSLDKLGWVRPFIWHKNRSLEVAGLYWEWLTDKGSAYGRAIGRDYLEVRYENLSTRPEEELAKIGCFIGHDLDYERIRHAAIGSVGEPNTSFDEETKSGDFNPVGRWRREGDRESVLALERLIGPALEKLGYSLTVPESSAKREKFSTGMRSVYRRYWDSKLWLKTRTPLARVFAKASPADL